MRFRVVDAVTPSAAGGHVLLVKDQWNDWFKWVTQFHVVVVLPNGERVNIGDVKIGRRGMTEENAVTHKIIPPLFEGLDDDWFSIGQSENYYETLNSIGRRFQVSFLKALRDCARNLRILDELQGERVLHESLLRDIDLDRVRNRFNRLAHGNAALTSYAFAYEFPIDPLANLSPPILTFDVVPNSHPPTNIHVLIGRNGVGKTRCFDLLSRAFLGLQDQEGSDPGELRSNTPPSPWAGRGHGFAGLVTVSFSPFDKYGPLADARPDLAVRYAYIGLIRESLDDVKIKNPVDSENVAPLTIKSHNDMSREFVRSVSKCRSGARLARWQRALEFLEADPLFEEANVTGISDKDLLNWESDAIKLFKKLSSGHSVVLLTITKLVELVEERSLVLIDEPEGHLHPPLLSAFLRALSDLLTNRNGVAIIATHSPVVLQEVPSSCVWILNRSGHEVRVDRPERETFGENVGSLTRDVFGLEVMQTGFYRMLIEVIEGKSYDELLEFFGGQLGGEARALARGLSLMPPSRRRPEQDL